MSDTEHVAEVVEVEQKEEKKPKTKRVSKKKSDESGGKAAKKIKKETTTSNDKQVSLRDANGRVVKVQKCFTAWHKQPDGSYTGGSERLWSFAPRASAQKYAAKVLGSPTEEVEMTQFLQQLEPPTGKYFCYQSIRRPNWARKKDENGQWQYLLDENGQRYLSSPIPKNKGTENEKQVGHKFFGESKSMPSLLPAFIALKYPVIDEIETTSA